MKKMDYLRDCKSKISNVCNAVEGHCFEAMKIVRHHANGRFDWLISEHQSVNRSREAISILSGKYKRFTFVHPVAETKEVIYESVNLKGAVYEPKQNSFSLQSVTTIENLFRIQCIDFISERVAILKGFLSTI